MLTTEYPYGPDFPILCVTNDYCHAKISLYGGQILEWTPKGQRNVFFVSPKLIVAHGRALRGGIPICWPWFGKHPEDKNKPSHGCARTALWTHANTEEEATCTRVVLALPTQDAILPNAALIIEFGEELLINLMTLDVPHHMPFSAGLHSYFAVSDYRNIAITGLEESPFVEYCKAPDEHCEDPLIPLGAIDRIYHPVPEEIEICLHDPDWNRSIRILRNGSKSSVVWQPGSELAATMDDLGEGNEEGFICVESNVSQAEQVSLRYGDTHSLITRIQVLAID